MQFFIIILPICTDSREPVVRIRYQSVKIPKLKIYTQGTVIFKHYNKFLGLVKFQNLYESIFHAGYKL